MKVASVELCSTSSERTALPDLEGRSKQVHSPPAQQQTLQAR